MGNKTYFMIDGSCFLQSIKDLKKIKNELKDKKLHIDKYAEALLSLWGEYIGYAVRTTFYFKKHDERIKNMLIVPDACIPKARNHWQIKECAEKLKTVPEEELSKLSSKYRDVFPRAEKGLDIKLVCDTLQLVSSGKADNIVLVVNDSDYLPFFEALQNLGANVYITSLDGRKKVNKKLANLSDRYLSLDQYIGNIFV